MNRHTFLPALAAVPVASTGSGATPALGSTMAPATQAVSQTASQMGGMAPAAAPAATAVAPAAQTAGQAASHAAPQTGTGGSMLPSLPDVNFSWGGYFEALAILCFVLAVIWAVLWLAKRRGSGGFFASSTPSMRIESRLALGPKKWLMVVRYLDRRLVLGVTDKSINLVTELYDQEFAAEAQPAPKNGSGKLTLAKKDAVVEDNAPQADKTQTGSPGARNSEDDDGPLSFASLLKKGKAPQAPR